MIITQSKWRSGHLFDVFCPTDAYYVKLANKLYTCIDAYGIDFPLSQDELCDTALSIAYYFEDVISEIGIWSTFTQTHKELYNKYLPFYEINEQEYYPEEINLEDVCLLLWMKVQRPNTKSVFNPESLSVTALASKLYSILDDEFEKAPINWKLNSLMYADLCFDDFYKTKDWCCELYSQIYLFKDATSKEEQGTIGKTLNMVFGDNEDAIEYTLKSILAFTSKVGPLAMTVPQWMSRLLKQKGMDEKARLVGSIECLPFSAYLIKAVDAKVFTLESVTGEIYALERNSFRELSDGALNCSVIYLSLARYGDADNWQVCGESAWFNDEGMFYGIQEKQRTTAAEEKRRLDKLMEVNDNYPLLYFANYQELKQWLVERVGLYNDLETLKGVEDMRMLLGFIENSGHVSLFPNNAVCIKDPRNPYYDKQKAQEQSISLLVRPQQASARMIHYLIENNMLPDACLKSADGSARGRQLVQENVDFMLRFFRQNQY